MITSSVDTLLIVVAWPRAPGDPGGSRLLQELAQAQGNGVALKVQATGQGEPFLGPVRVALSQDGEQHTFAVGVDGQSLRRMRIQRLTTGQDLTEEPFVATPFVQIGKQGAPVGFGTFL